MSAKKRRGRRGLVSVEEVINTEERNINLKIIDLYDHKEKDPLDHISVAKNGNGKKPIERVIG